MALNEMKGKESGPATGVTEFVHTKIPTEEYIRQDQTVAVSMKKDATVDIDDTSHFTKEQARFLVCPENLGPTAEEHGINLNKTRFTGRSRQEIHLWSYNH